MKQRKGESLLPFRRGNSNRYSLHLDKPSSSRKGEDVQLKRASWSSFPLLRFSSLDDRSCSDQQLNSVNSLNNNSDDVKQQKIKTKKQHKKQPKEQRVSSSEDLKQQQRKQKQGADKTPKIGCGFLRNSTASLRSAFSSSSSSSSSSFASSSSSHSVRSTTWSGGSSSITSILEGSFSEGHYDTCSGSRSSRGSTPDDHPSSRHRLPVVTSSGVRPSPPPNSTNDIITTYWPPHYTSTTLSNNLTTYYPPNNTYATSSEGLTSYLLPPTTYTASSGCFTNYLLPSSTSSAYNDSLTSCTLPQNTSTNISDSSPTCSQPCTHSNTTNYVTTSLRHGSLFTEDDTESPSPWSFSFFRNDQELNTTSPKILYAHKKTPDLRKSRKQLVRELEHLTKQNSSSPVTENLEKTSCSFEELEKTGERKGEERDEEKENVMPRKGDQKLSARKPKAQGFLASYRFLQAKGAKKAPRESPNSKEIEEGVSLGGYVTSENMTTEVHEGVPRVGYQKAADEHEIPSDKAKRDVSLTRTYSASPQHHHTQISSLLVSVAPNSQLVTCSQLLQSSQDHKQTSVSSTLGPRSQYFSSYSVSPCSKLVTSSQVYTNSHPLSEANPFLTTSSSSCYHDDCQTTCSSSGGPSQQSVVSTQSSGNSKKHYAQAFSLSSLLGRNNSPDPVEHVSLRNYDSSVHNVGEDLGVKAADWEVKTDYSGAKNTDFGVHDVNRSTKDGNSPVEHTSFDICNSNLGVNNNRVTQIVDGTTPYAYSRVNFEPVSSKPEVDVVKSMILNTPIEEEEEKDEEQEEDSECDISEFMIIDESFEKRLEKELEELGDKDQVIEIGSLEKLGDKEIEKVIKQDNKKQGESEREIHTQDKVIDQEIMEKLGDNKQETESRESDVCQNKGNAQNRPDLKLNLAKPQDKLVNQVVRSRLLRNISEEPDSGSVSGGEEEVELRSSPRTPSTPRSPAIDIDDVFKQKQREIEESSDDMSRVRDLANRLQLATRRPSYMDWLGVIKERGKVMGEVLETHTPVVLEEDQQQDEEELTNEKRKHNLQSALAWLRKELTEMRKQDQQLARQLMQLRIELQRVRLLRSCHHHQALVEEMTSEAEEARTYEASDLCELPADLRETFSPVLREIGVTRMNITSRRFSLR